MTATQPSSLRDQALHLYRRTLKRVRPIHKAAHWLASHSLIPFLERQQQFQTMADDPLWFRVELLTGRHEAETVAVAQRLVRPGMCVLDVGAHVGYYTRRFAEAVGAQGRVLAFEPHPRNFATLEANTGRYAQVTRLPYALTEAAGTAELHDYLMMSASGSLHYDTQLLEAQRSTQSAQDLAPRLEHFQPQTFTVATERADALLAAQGIRQVDVIKMDIEGAELGALRGLSQTIAASPQLALIMEYNPLGWQAFGVAPAEALDAILGLGFQRVQGIEADASLTDYTAQRSALNALTERLMQHMGVINLLLTK